VQPRASCAGAANLTQRPERTALAAPWRRAAARRLARGRDVGSRTAGARPGLAFSGPRGAATR